MFDLRLRTLLGVQRLQDVTWDDLQALLNNENAAEGPDIDYKAGPEPYKTGTEGAGEFVKDVLALANTSGGVLVLGVAEDRATSVPAAFVPVPLLDRVRKRYRECLAQRAAPYVECLIHFVPNAPGSNEGVMLVAVPPSASAPHAVTGFKDPYDGNLRYPWRNDNTTSFMTHAQVKNAIMAAMATSTARREVLLQAERDVLDSGVGGPIHVVTLVPDMPGSFTVNKASVEAFSASPRDFTWHPRHVLGHTAVGPRRLIATDAPSGGHHVAHLHTDGSGAWRSRATLITCINDAYTFSQAPIPCWDSQNLVEAALDKTTYLVRHATDTAGAAGTATLQISLNSAAPMQLGWWDEAAGAPFPFSAAACSEASGSASLLLDTAREGASDLVAAVAAALADLYQNFGVAEPEELTLDGKVNISRWRSRGREATERWAQAAGVELTVAQDRNGQ
ncbi:AlbA family DNA-binding domain-containing protein [Kitasatospora cineracea]|uniref:DNA-binding protein n=1 Tax=Kitasatospora cineracea TaxID=88074 RepID=A0A3N4R131_9ACTN|nr:ATP-binding protein [Kitasatospora cineracea]RPE27253.1 putative DNA-binding protein [Kitasatospora cineracea]